MIIDNTRATTFWLCPLKYYERFVKNIERDWGPNADALPFGKRVHELLEEHYREQQITVPCEYFPPYPECPNEAIELEAQALMAAYRNAYPVDSFTVVDVECTFQVAIPYTNHIYVGKLDAIVRDNDSGMLEILEHKTEKRSSKRNDPRAWAARSQASLYLWAAEQIYNEPFRDVLLNVLRRQSEKGQVGPEFPPRQRLQRTYAHKEEAIKNLVWIADQIEECEKTGFWPANRNHCMEGPFECDFYFVHLEGWTDELLRTKYKQAEKYLDMEGM